MPFYSKNLSGALGKVHSPEINLSHEISVFFQEEIKDLINQLRNGGHSIHELQKMRRLKTD